MVYIRILKLNTMCIETKRIGNYEIEIHTDESPESPRTSMDNLGKMICFHSRYSLGDKHDYDHRDYSGWEEQKEAIIKNEKVCVILPLYLYDHSGITISTSPFSCRWDSGQIGWVYVSKERVRKEYGVKRINQKLIEKVTKVLEGEVETYDQYLRGDIYGYKVFEVSPDGEKEEKDSCWGFYGQEYCMKEAEDIVGYYLKDEKIEEGRELSVN